MKTQKVVNYFLKKPPTMTFDRILDMPLIWMALNPLKTNVPFI